MEYSTLKLNLYPIVSVLLGGGGRASGTDTLTGIEYAYILLLVIIRRAQRLCYRFVM